MIAFWGCLIVAFYWLMHETHWLKVRLEDIRYRLPPDVWAMIDSLPVIFAAAIIVCALKSFADIVGTPTLKNTKPQRGWRQMLRAWFTYQLIQKIVAPPVARVK